MCIKNANNVQFNGYNFKICKAKTNFVGKFCLENNHNYTDQIMLFFRKC